MKGNRVRHLWLGTSTGNIGLEVKIGDAGGSWSCIKLGDWRSGCHNKKESYLQWFEI